MGDALVCAKRARNGHMSKTHSTHTHTHNKARCAKQTSWFRSETRKPNAKDTTDAVGKGRKGKGEGNQTTHTKTRLGYDWRLVFLPFVFELFFIFDRINKNPLWDHGTSKICYEGPALPRGRGRGLWCVPPSLFSGSSSRTVRVLCFLFACVFVRVVWP
jgi:hypothetical protein